MVRPKSLSFIAVLALVCFSCTGRANAQQQTASVQPPIHLAADLLAPLALQIQDNAQQIDCKPGKCKIAVTDFLFTGKGVTPFGIQLADLLSAQLFKDGFAVADRSEVQNLIQRDRLSPLNLQAPEAVRALGSELKADAILSADLTEVDGKTVAFSARVVQAGGKYKRLSLKGKLHIDLSRVDLSSLGEPGGLPPSSQTLQAQPGLMPSCSYMPNPPYTDEARRARSSGVVVVEAVVGADGRLTNIRIVRGLKGLDEITLETLATWKCQAPIRDGKAVPVVVNFEVNFKLQF
jgi:TonB family protein